MQIAVALDWTPNTLHTGIYVAQAKQLYQKAGLDVTIITPEADNYETTPAKRVANQTAHIGFAPSESVISYNTLPGKPPLQAIATVLQRNTSAIVTLQTSGINQPAHLEGKTYASYGARFEDDIIRQMIINDGGSGELLTVCPPKLGIWETLLNGKADATWIFDPWEGVQAKRAGIELYRFRPEKYGIDYGYTPVLLTHPEFLAKSPEAVKTFLRTTAEGYQFAASHPQEAAQLLMQTAQHPSLADQDMVLESQQLIAGEYLDREGHWGVMRWDRWQNFIDWLVYIHLLNEPSRSETLFTNDYLPHSKVARV